MTNVVQRALTIDDIPDLIALSKEVDWPDYNAEELTSLLTNGYFTGFSTIDGRVISCAGLFQYDQLASIGAVIVSETHRGLGLARKMIDTLIGQSDQSIPVVLTATVQGRPVYEKIGFHTAGYIHTYKAQKPNPEALRVSDDIHLSPADETHLPSIEALDEKGAGTNRSSFLKNRMNRAARRIIAKNEHHETTGFAFGVETPANLMIGPLAAIDELTALSLIHSLISSYSGAIRLDMQEETAERLHATLVEAGFTKTNKAHFMMIRRKEKQNDPALLYFLASQAFS
ncbi:GNAT family N-acetyltransferase [Bacillus pumilus]|uniref:GNAT family N-acetyltransferase n=1 Tax=Bacillus pumilus TaxID=1408 RepID=UPI00081FDA36|nr:GNAT family N-acetyltransferase [Bacillus pumilus]AOC57223.1 GNAT family N-acetyltransferase [Bacillus pumilus]MBR0587605.1 GNAT family N-acetyltransferase [Bacillus pumilus DW2J2]MBR0617389.1 GNAT family N-acetyltransferase [Bacillus pumilus]MBR0622915.1 GNAT family N-acetyltransferase [Bacillus pumilus]MCY7725074.1 GNAT family N-acetyltransferase [Bacillus pumilus]